MFILRPAHLPEGHPTGHVQSRGKPLAALVMFMFIKLRLLDKLLTNKTT